MERTASVEQLCFPGGCDKPEARKVASHPDFSFYSLYPSASIKRTLILRESTLPRPGWVGGPKGFLENSEIIAFDPSELRLQARKNSGLERPKTRFPCFFAALEELGGSKNQANNSKSICEKVGFLMLCLDPFS